MKRLAVCTTFLIAALAAAQSVAQAPAPEVTPVPPQGDGLQAPPAPVEVRDPQVVAESVREALGTDGVAATDDIVVSTHAETIVLTGQVGTEAEVAGAVSVAEAAAGNLRVSQQLTLDPGKRQAAEQEAAVLVRNVEAALQADQRTAGVGVAVSIDEGQVIGLHGLVPSREIRTAAEVVAARVKGVKQVRSRLVVPGE